MRPWSAFLLGLIVLLPAVSRRGLWAPDEPRHAEVAREMLVSGNWLVPHLNGEVYPDKPAPPFWLMALAMKATGGAREWAARLPFVMAAAGTLALVAHTAASFGGGLAATLAVLFLLTAGRYLWLAQRVSLDVLLTFFVTLAIVGWLRQRRGAGRDWVNGALFFGAAALGVASKGPLGFLVPLFTAITHGLGTRTLARLARPGFLGVGVPFFLVLTAAWLVPTCLAGGPAYTNELLFHQSAGRVFDAWNHAHGPWYYLPKLVTEFLPWSPLLLLAMWQLLRGRTDVGRDARWLLLGWFLPAFVFLSIVQSKRGNYLLSLYPAVAMAGGLCVRQWITTGAWRRMLHGVTVGVAVLWLVLGVAVLAAPALPQVQELGLAGVWVAAITTALVLIPGGIVTLRRARGSPERGLIAAAAVALVLTAEAGLVVMPVVDPCKSERDLARTLAAHAASPDEGVPFLDVSAEAFRFYTGLDCREINKGAKFVRALNDPGVRLAVLEGDEYGDLAGRIPADFQEVARKRVSSKGEIVVLSRSHGARRD